MATALRDHPADDETTTLDALRAVGADEQTGFNRVIALLRRDEAIASLATTLWPALQTLAGVPTDDDTRPSLGGHVIEPSKLNVRCVEGLNVSLDDPALRPRAPGALIASGGGLENLIGSPDARTFEAMESEHCASQDSDQQFTDATYLVTSTARIEWHFVVHGAAGLSALGLDGYPAERTGCDYGAIRPRTPLDLSEFEEARESINHRLGLLDDGPLPPLEVFEVVAARLYTGPLGATYNATLRRCAQQPVRDGDTASAGAFGGEDATSKRNKYTNTLHSLSSCLFKLSRLMTTTGTVYRAVRGGPSGLPEGLRTANEYGACGVAEYGCLTATRELPDAMAYATAPPTRAAMATKAVRFTAIGEEEAPPSPESVTMHGFGETNDGIKDAGGDKAAGVVLAIHQTMTARGASLEWLSQYPNEREVTFPPLTSIEVVGVRAMVATRTPMPANVVVESVEEGDRPYDGRVVMVDARPSIRLPPMTVERYVGRRRHLLEEQALHFGAEVRGALSGTAWARIGDVWVDSVLRDIRARPEVWYHEGSLDGEHFVQAASELVSAKQRVASSDVRLRLQWLAEQHSEEVAMASRLAGVEALGSPHVETRSAAVELLLRLPPDSLHHLGADIVAHLKSTADGVRSDVVAVLGHIAPFGSGGHALGPHAATAVTNLADATFDVRSAAHVVLGTIEPVALLATPDGRLKPAAVEVLCEVDSDVLYKHAPAVVAYLLHPTAEVRCAALEVLGCLAPSDLQGEYLGAMVAAMVDPEEKVGKMAKDVLCGISETSCLASQLLALASLLTHAKRETSDGAASVLRRIEVGVRRERALMSVPDTLRMVMRKHGLL